MSETTIAIVGGGPRGISTLERLGAYLSEVPEDSPTSLTVHIIDDWQIGAGSIWRTDQTRTLCMNTMAHGVTLFTEPGATVGGPVWKGPTLFEWAQLMRGDSDYVPVEHRLATSEKTFADYREEITDMVEQSHPTRALYGEYLRWCYSVTLERLPASITVVEHLGRVIDLRPQGDSDVLTIRTTDGTDQETTLTADYTVLALGWVTPAPTEEEKNLASAKGTWIKPANPIEQDLDQVPAGEKVLVRGLGMGFFDVMAMLTMDRGGRFEPADTRSGLRYVPSGKEPHLVVASGRGFPYLAKPQYGSLPPASHLPRTTKIIAELMGSTDIDYDATVFPAVIRDAYEAYYLTYGLEKDVVAEIVDNHDTIEALTAAFAELVPAEDVFDLNREAAPLAGLNLTPEELTAHIAEGVARDLHDSEQGAASARKAGLASVGGARKPSSILGTPGRIRPGSRGLGFVKRLGQMAGSGPPAFRNQELIALIDAGLVTFLGAQPTVTVTDRVFRMSSPTTGNEPVESTTLIDAWMHQPNTERLADPLLVQLSNDGRSTPYVFPDGSHAGSPDIEQSTGQLIDDDAQPDSRVFAMGIPLYDVRPDTTISPLPGSDPAFLQETDLVAGAIVKRLLG